MNRLTPCLFVAAVILVAQGSHGDVPQKKNSPDSALTAGKWKVEFTNGVIEACNVFEHDGWHATVEEPQRRSRGTVVVKDGSFVITFADDRIERWTPLGKRFVVEHFFPGSQFPSGTPVLGIGERTP